MTIFAPSPEAKVPFAAVPAFFEQRPHQVRSYDKSAKAQRTYELKQRVFPVDGGAALLKMYEYPKLVVHVDKREFELKEWGISLPLDKVTELPSRIIHTYLTLEAKAERGTLSPSEVEQWLSILDSVDHEGFSFDRAAPHYSEGQLVKHYPTTVRWSDGQEEKLSGNCAAALSWLQPGDLFSALVKLDRANRPLKIEQVKIIPEPISV